MDAIYGCDTCRSTIGRAGCPTHRDSNAYTDEAGAFHYTGSGLVMTHCIHGLDLRLHPRCYLCKPLAATPAPLDEARYWAKYEGVVAGMAAASPVPLDVEPFLWLRWLEPDGSWRHVTYRVNPDGTQELIATSAEQILARHQVAREYAQSEEAKP